jgi:hypothetical protein
MFPLVFALPLFCPHPSVKMVISFGFMAYLQYIKVRRTQTIRPNQFWLHEANHALTISLTTDSRFESGTHALIFFYPFPSDIYYTI